jgi:hypothetical protein
MHEIWLSEATGTRQGPRFRLLDDAIRYVNGYADEGSLAILMSDGNWYRWSDDNVIIENRRRARRISAAGACRVSAQRGRRQVEALRCRVKDVSSTGLGLVPWATASEMSDSVVSVILGEGTNKFEVPALVKWRAGRDVGIELMLENEPDRTRYQLWLERIVGAHLH